MSVEQIISRNKGEASSAELETAVRPNVADRRPLLGSYGYGTDQHLFNGMGSKGVMLAPYFAHQLVRHIWHGEPLDPEVDMMRFGKRMVTAGR